MLLYLLNSCLKLLLFWKKKFFFNQFITLTGPILIKCLMRYNWKSWLMKYSSINTPFDYFCLNFYRRFADIAIYIWGKKSIFSTNCILQMGKTRGKLVTQQTDSNIHLLSYKRDNSKKKKNPLKCSKLQPVLYIRW